MPKQLGDLIHQSATELDQLERIKAVAEAQLWDTQRRIRRAETLLCGESANPSPQLHPETSSATSTARASDLISVLQSPEAAGPSTVAHSQHYSMDVMLDATSPNTSLGRHNGPRML